MKPQVVLSQVQALWLKELGVDMLWGRELQASTPLVMDKSNALAGSSPTQVQISAPVSPSVDQPSQPLNEESRQSSEVGLIKRSSPEGRTKSGRTSQQQAIQTIQKGFAQLARHQYRQAAALSASLPSVQSHTWEDLEQEIKQQYLQWGWVQNVHEVLLGQQGKQPLSLLIIEEMPGIDDVMDGQVFAGESGQLLANMLAPLKLDKKEVAITSLFKFHARDEQIPIQCAIPYLQAQIQLLQPKCIWLLGTRAAQSFLQQDSHSMESLRQQIWQYPLSADKQIPVVVSHHPSLLLVTPNLKADIWTDLQRLAQYL